MLIKSNNKASNKAKLFLDWDRESPETLKQIRIIH